MFFLVYHRAEKEWGDGIRGLALSAARFSLLRVEEGPPHAKNWRPQIMIFVKLNQDLIPVDKKLLALANQLKAGKGLTMVYSILKGEFQQNISEASIAKINLKKHLEEEKVKGFSDVLVCPDIATGIESMYVTT